MKRKRLCVCAVAMCLCGALGLRAQQSSESRNDGQSSHAAEIAPNISGSGTPGFLADWTTTTNLGNSIVFQKSGNVGVGIQTPAAKLDVNGTGKFHGLVTFTSGQRFPGTATLGANTFTATQTVSSGDLSIENGNLDLPNTTGSGAGIINLGGNAFIHACCLTGGGNIFIGPTAGNFATSATQNTAIGQYSLNEVTTGSSNTALGASTMVGVQTGSSNVAFGTSALSGDGSFNVAIGAGSLNSNNSNSADNNVAIGASTMGANTSGYDNVAVGYQALNQNTTGFLSVGVGYLALSSNQAGISNTAVGNTTLNYLTSGSGNIALGSYAGTQLTTGNNDIYIGNSGNGSGTVSESNVLRIGQYQTAAFISGVYGATTGTNDAIPVMVDSNGQLGTMSSSRRYKEDIHDMGDTSAGLLRLRPVTFRYRRRYADGSEPIQYGLIAEEVAEVYPDLVVRDKEGQPETVQYWKLDVMLLNELQKLTKAHAADQERIEELEAQTRKAQSLEERLTALQARLDRLEAGRRTQEAERLSR
jgi:hypothetical protein